MNKIALNTFGEGLNMDLNALVTPNNIMTNCLNGTLITYNGNENVLQNDMGNGKVHDAYLPAGYVPVGMSEYGGIIYVAAYNPEQNLSLIGCFPSPLLNYENNKSGQEIEFLLVEGKYKLFTGENKDLEILPGCKLAVDLGNTIKGYNNILPNYNYDPKERKERWSLKLCVLSSNGLLIDITDLFEILDNYDYISEYKPEYQNYFFLDAEVSDPSSLSKYLRVYKGNRTGTPYIKVELNLAEDMDISVASYNDVENKVVTFTVISTITSDSKLYPLDGKGLNGLLCIAKTNSGLEISQEITPNENKVVIGSYTNIENRIKGLVEIGYPNEWFGTEDNLLYTTSNYKVVSLLDNKYVFYLVEKVEVPYIDADSTIELTINPYFKWDDEIVILESLEYNLTFEISKIGTGLHEINLWRYYVSDDFITLVWGMESYPLPGEDITLLTMTFYGSYDDNPSLSNTERLLVLFEKSYNYLSFNGEFSEVFDITDFDYTTVDGNTSHRYPSICKITWYYSTGEDYTYRWVLPTKLYNGLYHKHLDYSSDEAISDIQEINKVEDKVASIQNGPSVKLNTTWNNYASMSKNKLSIDHITGVNTYLFNIPNPVIDSSYQYAKDYPFERLFSKEESKLRKAELTIEDLQPNAENLNDIESLGILFLSNIDNSNMTLLVATLKTILSITYEEKESPIVKKEFKSYYKDGFPNTLYYNNPTIDSLVVVSVRYHEGDWDTDNPLEVYASSLYVKENGVVDRLDNILLFNKTSHSNNTIYINDYWSLISNLLSKMSLMSKYPYCVPIVFVGHAYSSDLGEYNYEDASDCYYYFNFAIRNSEKDWILYYPDSISGYLRFSNKLEFRPYRLCDNDNDKNRLYRGAFPLLILNINNKLKSNGGMLVFCNNHYPYFRLSHTNFKLEGNFYVIKNGTYASIVGEDNEYTATIDIEAITKVNFVRDYDHTMNYNSSIETIVNHLNNFENPKGLNLEYLNKSLQFYFVVPPGSNPPNYINLKTESTQIILKTYTFSVLYPSNIDIYNEISNSSTELDTIINFDNEYYITEEELEPECVYRLLNKNPLTLTSSIDGAGIVKVSSGNIHITATDLIPHSDRVVADMYDGKHAEISLRDLLTIAGNSIFTNDTLL